MKGRAEVVAKFNFVGIVLKIVKYDSNCFILKHICSLFHLKNIPHIHPLSAFLSLCTIPMIVGEIRRYLRDNSALRISRSMRDTAYKILRAREALLVETQREPTVEQLARYLDIPREDVVFAMDAFSDPVSLYEPLYADSGDTVCVMDQVRDEKNTDESWLDRIALKDAIARLDPRQRSILALRFCQGKTQMEVSSEIGISQAQVSRLEKTALSSIRKNM